jgi:hypothetical protein
MESGNLCSSEQNAASSSAIANYFVKTHNKIAFNFLFTFEYSD